MASTMAGGPADYNAWYATPRGAWISHCEYQLMMSMMRPQAGKTLLDVGCGTGHFTRLFATSGLKVTGVDPDTASIEFAKSHSQEDSYFLGDARQLSYEQGSFDYCSAVTSLCFIDEPERALQEMWRVCRKGIMLGLLNRNSLLYMERGKHPGYDGARWDSAKDARKWIASLGEQPKKVLVRSAVNFPKAATLGRMMEKIIPPRFLFGSFLAVYIQK